jgi:hypothetical protein
VRKKIAVIDSPPHKISLVFCEIVNETAMSTNDRLLEKGKLLYFNDCGLDGVNRCAAGFALHHVAMGHWEIVERYLTFLESEWNLIRKSTEVDRCEMTAGLIITIREAIQQHQRDVDVNPSTHS